MSKKIWILLIVAILFVVTAGAVILHRVLVPDPELTKEQADPARNPICKTRYCLAHGKHYFEINVYPFWSDKAVMEIELLTENEPFEIPPFVNVLEDVTDDKRYVSFGQIADCP